MKSEDDIAELEKRLRQLPTAISSIKNEISEDQLKLKRVSDLIAAYEKIVEGNYIDNLIREQSEPNKALLKQKVFRKLFAYVTNAPLTFLPQNDIISIRR